ncbi:uroporphyrinogen-III synthase isoform X5 [Puntigrus tetrazona]|uniref:uroporphyrinogen-III synthase isoform X5 n=1 Tax=Puntigrus tetrazona TaxID=1606681 RepID=UPI001C8A4DBC|nr:uroporphyrinogen-III synthase isoform X5 [Puntigrus tetrazona]
MKVLLLKEPRESETEADPYIQELASCGHTASLIPVLSFRLVSLEELSERLLQPERFGGLIFTSPRAVEAVQTCLHSLTHKWDAVKDKWNEKSVYVVGKATASLDIPLETLTVYQTSEHPDLQNNVTDYFTRQGVPASVAFFSPSGVKFCLDLVKRLSGSQLEKIKFASIGPTTADALRSHGLPVSCCAEKPTAKHLAAAITHALHA